MKGATRSLLLCITALGLGSLTAAQTSSGTEKAVRGVVAQFEDGLKQRDLKKIEAVVADDLVALENGHRNDGWADFRDHHLVPEMKEPAPETKTEMMRLSVGSDMAWAYTKSEMQVTGKDGDKINLLLWSTYILEKRGKEWKIVLLDWSLRRIRPPAK